jgi:hypothetical protein
VSVNCCSGVYSYHKNGPLEVYVEKEDEKKISKKMRKGEEGRGWGARK